MIPGLDVIVGGHSHDALSTPLEANGKIIVQAGDYGKFIGETRLLCGRKSNISRVSLTGYELYRVNRKIQEDPELQDEMNRLREGIIRDPRFGQVYDRPVATAAWNLEERWEEGNPFRDTALGNLIADAIKSGVEKAGHKVDLSLEAMGYIGHRIYEGSVAGNDILRTVPYGYDPDSGLGYKIVIVPLAGQLVLGGLEYSVSSAEYGDDLCLQVSGLKFAYDSRKNPGQGEMRVDPSSVLVNGRPISLDNSKIYLVAMTEQVYGFLKGLNPTAIPEPIPTGLFEYNLIRDYMMELDSLEYKAEGRVVDRKFQIPSP
jgi:2',3'-cyclic-nucleotide 2'-phosphodiesterase (5'-nucleotidase family)